MNKTTEVVLSLRGHDKGVIYAVVGCADDAHVLIADGRNRKLSKPKKKKHKHLRALGSIELPQAQTVTNRVLWRALREFGKAGDAASRGR